MLSIDFFFFLRIVFLNSFCFPFTYRLNPSDFFTLLHYSCYYIFIIITANPSLSFPDTHCLSLLRLQLLHSIISKTFLLFIIFFHCCPVTTTLSHSFQTLRQFSLLFTWSIFNTFISLLTPFTPFQYCYFLS